MDIERAKSLLGALADGVDPLTGEILPEDHCCNQTEIVRAIYTVLLKLNAADEKYRRPMSINAGKPWTKEDEAILCRMYDAGSSRKDICQYLRRSPGAIAARLVQLGKLQDRDEFRKQ